MMVPSKQTMRKKLRSSAGRIRDYIRLSSLAKREHLIDFLRPPSIDPGIDSAVSAAIAWLCRAQDFSASQDGGVARDFNIARAAWGASYPETTGYIIPTMIQCSKELNDAALSQRAKKMLDWLVSIQFPEGGFQGGTIDSQPVVPVTFNTGQILLGLASGAIAFGEPYHSSMLKAADWLVATQDPDGCWRRHATPFAEPGEKAYETHVAWSLFEAARLEPTRGYARAAIANIQWALTHQRGNGWFANCCLDNPSNPLTHTLGYTLRGLLEAYRFTEDKDILAAAVKTGDGLTHALKSDGFLPGRLNRSWEAAVDWVCLTGSVQIAYCWMVLWEYTGEDRFRDAAFMTNKYVRRTMKFHGSPDFYGGIKGSFPVFGDYGKYELLNWACKFFIDANLLEKSIRQRTNKWL